MAFSNHLLDLSQDIIDPFNEAQSLSVKDHIFFEIHPELGNLSRLLYEAEMNLEDVIRDFTDYLTETLLNAWGKITHGPDKVFHNI